MLPVGVVATIRFLPDPAFSDLAFSASFDINELSSGEGGETICPPPADGSSTVAYRFAANHVIRVSPWI